MTYKYLFGPIPSRRLGISLGIDMVPMKYCSMNCVYCESGKTTSLTTCRKEYIPLNTIIEELDDFLSSNKNIDYITFSGAGEPLLNSGIGDLIKHIKTNYPAFKLALITNSSFLTDSGIKNEIKDIDLIVPSLDAVLEKSFRIINRPEKSINLNSIIESLIEFKKISKAQMWLEVFLIEGINDSEEELKLFKEIITRINPDKIQLNSLDRPGTEEWVKPVSMERLLEISAFFEPLNAEIIAKPKNNKFIESAKTDIKETIIAAVKRRPCTINDLVVFLGSDENNINNAIQDLLKDNILKTENRERGLFYLLNK